MVNSTSVTNRADQKLDVTFGAADRAFDDTKNTPALRREPGGDPVADLAMQRRIAHHAAFADAVWANLELRLDQRHEIRLLLGQRQRRRQHGLEADEAGVADHEIDWLRHLRRRDVAGVDAVQERDA